MKKIKILFGTVHMEVGGIERTLIGLLNRLDYDRYDVDLLLLKTDGDFIKDIPKNVNIITPYKTKIMEHIVNSKNIVFKMIKHTLFNYRTASLWTTNKEYDVAISYSGYYSFIDMYIGNVKAKKKFIWVHTDLKFIYENDVNYRKKFNRTKKKYDKFDKIVGVSESVVEHFLEIMPSAKNKVTVLWNIMDKPQTRGICPKLNGKIKIVSVGRLCNQKRFDKLIMIHKKLIDNGYNVKTYLVGDGENYDELKSLVKSKEIEDSFIMLGKQINVIGILNQADLFVSTSDYEGLPTVLMESLMCNLPFVGPDVCGINDIARFIAPKNSFIITENNTDSIYKGIVCAIDGKINKDFKFDLNEYNNNTIKKFYDLINK